MLKSKKEIHGHNITVLGDFNPKIFQPSWFALNELIGNKEAEDAEIKIIHPDVVAFKLEWLTLQVTRQQFQVNSTNEAFHDAVRDLVVGTFKILYHTPLKMVGINNQIHYSLTSEEEWKKFSNILTPPKFWTKVFKNPEMQDIAIRDKRKSGPIGYTHINIQKSIHLNNGIYFGINEHYEVADQKTTVGSTEIVKVIEENWKIAMDRATNVIESIWEDKNEHNKK